MTTTAKLLDDGDDQIVLLPDGFHFACAEVRISKVGDKVILEPSKQQQPVDFDKFWAELDALGARDFLPDGAPDDAPSDGTT